MTRMTSATSDKTNKRKTCFSLVYYFGTMYARERSAEKDRLDAYIRWERWWDWQAGSTRRDAASRETRGTHCGDTRVVSGHAYRICYLPPENARFSVVTDSPILYPPPRTHALNDSYNSRVGVADTRESARFEPTSVPNKGRNFGWRAPFVTTLQGRTAIRLARLCRKFETRVLTFSKRNRKQRRKEKERERERERERTF